MTNNTGGSARRSSIPLFRVFDIEIRLDVSVTLIFVLIVYSLGVGLLPAWHADWSRPMIWLTALGCGVMFFVSLLAHELSHSLVARHFGIRVPRITLFLFGGMAEIESEARLPMNELAMAIAGPLMSLALAVLFMLIASSGMGEGTRAMFVEDTAAAIAQLNPLLTACLWLATTNATLAVFNMIPGFPLDGGRVLRAAIWWYTGDQLVATRTASRAGRGFGWGLMAWGFWNLLALRDVGGLWLILIGWFLSSLAAASYTQLLTERTLGSLRIGDIMRTHFDTVGLRVTLEDFIENHLLRSNQALWPVVDGDTVHGFVSLAAVANLPVEDRRSRCVGDVMRNVQNSRVLDVDAQASKALGSVVSASDEVVPVMRNGRVVGLINGSDLLRWLTLHREQVAHS